MIEVRAAFTLQQPISQAQVQRTAQDVAQWGDLTLHHLRAGVADGWIVLRAVLPSTTEQAQAWFFQTLQELENTHTSARLFRVEINRLEPGPTSGPALAS